MKEDILNPVVPVKIRGELVEVRELTWKDYLRAVKESAGALMKLITPDGKAVQFNKDTIIEVLTSQEDVAGWVLEKSTGKDAKFIAGLSAREIIPLLQAVVDLNLSEEVVGPGKILAGRMVDLLGLKTLSQGPPTTSSPPATATKK